ncbi:MAG: hypothetical protein V3U80_08385 [Flavobacteriaceae bacterium]
MKKLIYSIAFLSITFLMKSQTPLKDLLQTKNWMNVSSRQVSSLKIKQHNYDIILMPEDRADMFWGNVIKLDSLNNYRNYKSSRCGTPPYSIYNITGKWQVNGDKLCINIESAILDCTYEVEKCKKKEQIFIKKNKERKIEYALKVVNDSLIVGKKIN